VRKFTPEERFHLIKIIALSLGLPILLVFGLWRVSDLNVWVCVGVFLTYLLLKGLQIHARKILNEKADKSARSPMEP